MRKIVLFLSIISIIVGNGITADKPYEATWLEITKTGNGYVVYDYPSLWGTEDTKSPEIIRIRDDSLTFVTFSDEPMFFKLSNINYLNENLYCMLGKTVQLKRGIVFKFDYDKGKHIAEWTVYENSGRIVKKGLYIDSLHNIFPIVDFEWDDGPIDGAWDD